MANLTDKEEILRGLEKLISPFGVEKKYADLGDEQIFDLLKNFKELKEKSLAKKDEQRGTQ